jgi:hypothetical protein
LVERRRIRHGLFFAQLAIEKALKAHVCRHNLPFSGPRASRGMRRGEIRSPSAGTRKIDETIKRKLYERFDVREYWIVDPELDAMKVYRRVGGAFARVAELSAEAGDTLTTPLLPDFSAPLADSFASPL